MKSRKPFILSVAFALCSLPVLALAAATDAGGFSPAYLSCQKSAGSQVLASDACMTTELKYQDARLNKAYKSLLDTLKPDAKKALVDAERTWLQSASKDGEFETALYGDGQATNAQQTENKLNRVRARASTLEKYLEFAQL